ncbi:MAG: hypothetical protein M5U10_14455 [Candidatus Methanoperedens sp.]|uniref:hypothetical protein n=1 Tax=Candidatus Methanoperedens nitratireducens TaxID=1392998 RepID=UPI0012FF2A3C|nr:hypothetical protein [Candidatus Methanoperedens nitroreducens]MDJ1423106.1 hypothetical protein [Candidatus Methanoperedens sp.]
MLEIELVLDKKAKVLALMILVLVAALVLALPRDTEEVLHEEPEPEPSVSIGCDRVLWKDTEIELAASTRNIDKPLFEWNIDGEIAGSSRKFRKKFDMGEHQVVLNVIFDNGTLTADQSILVVDSADGISLRDSAASKNQWGFQTLYRGKNKGVKGVRVSIDSLPATEVNPCGSLSTKALFAGEHTWRAEYRGITIASGTFNIKEVSEIKITKIDIAPSYTTGDTVDGKIILKNTGSTIVSGFDTKTLVVNNNYAWMGDKAKKEFFSQHNSDIKPGEIYEIPIRVTIPEKISGVRPSGKYTITAALILNGQTIDTKVVNTVVK